MSFIDENLKRDIESNNCFAYPITDWIMKKVQFVDWLSIWKYSTWKYISELSLENVISAKHQTIYDALCSILVFITVPYHVREIWVARYYGFLFYGWFWETWFRSLDKLTHGRGNACFTKTAQIARVLIFFAYFLAVLHLLPVFFSGLGHNASGSW